MFFLNRVNSRRCLVLFRRFKIRRDHVYVRLTRLALQASRFRSLSRCVMRRRCRRGRGSTSRSRAYSRHALILDLANLVNIVSSFRCLKSTYDTSLRVSTSNVVCNKANVFMHFNVSTTVMVRVNRFTRDPLVPI